jgi:hypothetical protein
MTVEILSENLLVLLWVEIGSTILLISFVSCGELTSMYTYTLQAKMIQNWPRSSTGLSHRAPKTHPRANSKVAA